MRKKLRKKLREERKKLEAMEVETPEPVEKTPWRCSKPIDR